MTSLACDRLRREDARLISQRERGRLTRTEFQQQLSAVLVRINRELGAYLAVHTALGGR